MKRCVADLDISRVVVGKGKTTFFNRLDHVIVKLMNRDSEKQLGHWRFETLAVHYQQSVIDCGRLHNLRVFFHPVLKLRHKLISESFLGFETFASGAISSLFQSKTFFMN